MNKLSTERRAAVVRSLIEGNSVRATVRLTGAAKNGATKQWVMGNPVRQMVSTSHIERQNLTMRTQMRRFTRLTNGYSKRLENHKAAIHLHFAHYNFCRVHHTLTRGKGGIHQTLAIAAGLTDRVWLVSDLIGLLDSK